MESTPILWVYSTDHYKSFAHLSDSHHRFIPYHSTSACPKMHHLSGHRTGCKHAIEQLKTAMTEAPIPDFDKPFRLETDTYILGLGAVLAQEGGDNTVQTERTMAPPSWRHCDSLWQWNTTCTAIAVLPTLTTKLLQTPHPPGKLDHWRLTLQGAQYWNMLLTWENRDALSYRGSSSYRWIVWRTQMRQK